MVCLDLKNKEVREWVDSVGLEETYRQLIIHSNSLPTYSEYVKASNLPLLSMENIKSLYKSILPVNSFQFQEIEKLRNKTPEAQAAFWNQVFYFSKSTDLRQANEEAFHAIFQTLIEDQGLKRDLLDHGYDLLSKRVDNVKTHLKEQEGYLGLTGEDLIDYLSEEELAKEFVNFKTYNSFIKNPITKGLREKLIEFFKKIGRLLGLYKNNQEKLHGFFDSINQGKFKNVKINQENNTIAPSLTPFLIEKDGQSIVYNVEQQRKHYGTLMNIFFQLERISPYKEDGIPFTDNELAEKTIDIFKSAYKNSEDLNTRLLVKSLDEVENVDFLFGESDIEFINSDNYNLLIKDIVQNVKKANLEQLSEDLQIDEEGVPKLFSDSSILDTKDFFKSYSKMVKTYLSTIPVSKIKEVQRTLFNEDGKKEKHKIKVQNLVDPKRLYAVAVRITGNSEDSLDRLKKLITYANDSENIEFNAFVDKFLYDSFLVDSRKNPKNLLPTLKNHILNLKFETQLQEGDYPIQNITVFKAINKAFSLSTREYRMYFFDQLGRGNTSSANPAYTATVNVQLSSWQEEWEKRKVELYTKHKNLLVSGFGSPFAAQYLELQEGHSLFLDKQFKDLRDFFSMLGIKLSNNYIKFIISSYLKSKGAEYLPTEYANLYELNLLDSNEVFDIDNLAGLVVAIKKQNTNYLEDPDSMFDPYFIDEEEKEGLVTRLKRAARGNAYFDEAVTLSSFQDADQKARYGHQYPTFFLEFGNKVLKTKENLTSFVENNEFATPENNPLLKTYLEANPSLYRFFKTVSNIGVVSQLINDQKQWEYTEDKKSTVSDFSASSSPIINANAFIEDYKKIGNIKTALYNIGTLETSNTNSFFTGVVFGKTLEARFKDPKTGLTTISYGNSLINQNGEATAELGNILYDIIATESDRIQKEHNKLKSIILKNIGEETTIKDDVKGYKVRLTESDVTSVLDEVITDFHTGEVWVNSEGELLNENLENKNSPRAFHFSQALKGITNNSINRQMLNESISKDNIVPSIQSQFNTLLNDHSQFITDDLRMLSNVFYDSRSKNKNLQKSLGFYSFEDKADLNKELNLRIYFTNSILNNIYMSRILFGDYAKNNKNNLDDYSKRVKPIESGVIDVSYSLVDPSRGVEKPFTDLKVVMFKDAESYKDDVSGVDGKPVDSNDAQSYISTFHMRKLMFGLDRLDNFTTVILDKVQEGIPLTKQENEKLKNYVNIQKTRGLGSELDLKTSALPLTKELVGFPVETTEDVYNANAIYYPTKKGSGFSKPKPGATVVVSKKKVKIPGSNQYKDVYYRWEDYGDKSYLYEKMLLLEGWRKEGSSYVYKGSEFEIDVMSPISAHKRKKVNVWDEKKSIKNKNVLTYNISSKNKYGLQVENPAGKTSIPSPTQEIEIITSEFGRDFTMITEDGSSIKLSKDEVISRFQNLLNNRKVNSFEMALRELYDKEGNPNYKRFFSRIQDTLQETGGDVQLLSFFTTDDKGNPQFNPNIPAVKNKFEQSLFSLFGKGVLMQKVDGESKAMFSPRGVGIVKKLKKHSSGIYYWEAITDRQELLKARKEANENNFVLQGLTYNGLDSTPEHNTLLSKFDDMVEKGQTYFIDELRHLTPRVQSNVVNGHFSEALMPYYNVKQDAIQESYKYMSGVRIPSQDKATSTNLVWVQSMPYYFGNSISVAKEVAQLAGSDFDIDKLFVSKYSGHWVGKKFVPYSSSGLLFEEYKDYLYKTNNLFRSLVKEEVESNSEYNNLLSLARESIRQIEYELSDINLNLNVLYSNRNEVKDTLEELMEDLLYFSQQNDLVTVNDLKASISNTKSILKNNKKGIKKVSDKKDYLVEELVGFEIALNSMKEMLESKVLKDLNLPSVPSEYNQNKNNGLINNQILDLKFNLLTNNYEAYSRPTDVAKLKNLDNSTFGVLDRSEFTDSLQYSPFTPLYQQSYLEKIRAAATGIGSSVNANLVGLTLNRLGVVLNESHQIKVITKNGKELLYDRFTENTLLEDDLLEPSFGWLSSLITATTDEAKEGVLAFFNLYDGALDVFSTGVILGIHPELLVHLVNHPVIQEAIKNSKRDPLSVDYSTSLKNTLAPLRLHNVNRPESFSQAQVWDLNTENTEQTVEVFLRLLETAEQNASLIQFIRLKRGFGSTYEDFSSLLTAGLALNLDSIIPFYKDPLVSQYRKEVHLAYDLPKYLKEKSHLVQDTYNNMEYIVPQMNKVLSDFLVEGSTNFNILHSHLKNVAVVKGEDVQSFNKEIFGFVIGQIAKKSNNYNLDSSLIVDTGQPTLAERYLDIQKKYKDDVSIQESVLFKKLKADLSIDKKKRKKNQSIIDPRDSTSTFELNIFSKASPELNSDLMDDYFRLERHPDEEIRSFLSDLFSYYILKDGTFYSPSGISKIFPNYKFKALSNGLDAFMSMSISNPTQYQQLAEERIMLDVRNSKHIKRVVPMIGDVNTYYKNPTNVEGLTSIINLRTDIEDLYAKDKMFNTVEGRVIYPQVIQIGQTVFKKIGVGKKTIMYAETPLLGINNIYSSIATKVIATPTTNISDIIKRVESSLYYIKSSENLQNYPYILDKITNEITNHLAYLNNLKGQQVTLVNDVQVVEDIENPDVEGEFQNEEC